MPLTVRKFKAKVRDSQTGNMIPAGLLSSDALEAIEDAKDLALDEIDEQVDIATDAAAAAQESAQSAASAALNGNLAPQYSGTATYEIGDHVLQNGTLYRCNTTISSPQSTFVAAHWTQVKIGPQVDDIIKINQPADDGTKIRVVTSDEDVDLVTVEDLDDYVPRPEDDPSGTAGYVLRTNGDGTTQWADEARPTDTQTQNAVNAWMESHSGQYVIPDGNVTTAKIADEAVVQGKIADGAVTQDKLDDELKLKVIKDYVTPEMFGAKGDGVTDDTNALISMFNTKLPCYITKTYLCTRILTVESDIFGCGTFKYGANDVSINIEEDNITINGINFNVNNYITSAIKVTDVENIHIENCNILNTGNDNVTRQVGAISVTNVKNLWIKNCIIKYVHAGAGYSSYGIAINTSTNIFIENNNIEDIFPLSDGDGIRLNGEKLYAYIKNNIFKNCRKRCIKMKGEEIHSISNTFIYENLDSLGLAVIDFQRSNNESINDKLIFIITDSSLTTQLGNVFIVCGNNIKIDNFTNENIIPENYTLNVINGSCFVRLDKNIDVGSSNSADNLIISNCKINNICSYLIDTTANTALTSANNIQLINIEYAKNTSLSAYYVIPMNNSKMQIVDRLIIDGFTNRRNGSDSYSLLQRDTYTNTKIIIKNINDIAPFLWYSSGNIIVENTTKPFNNSVYEGYKQYKNKLELIYTGNTVNPSGNTSSAHQYARNTPVGTQLLFDAPIYDSTNNKMQIGFVCTVAGTATAVGTFVPLYNQLS